jgi:hypothetical protein
MVAKYMNKRLHVLKANVIFHLNYVEKTSAGCLF